MEGCLLVVEDDAENDPYDGAEPSNESTRTATPLSFQTFGGHDSPRVQNFSGAASNSKIIDQIPIPDNINPTRPSLDSFQSSSPSTAPPTTPTRLEGSESAVGNTSPTSLLVMSDPPTTPEPKSPRLLNNPVEKPRTLRSRREFRMFDKPANMDFESNASGTDMPTAAGETRSSAPPQESGGTLRRTSKRKPRPKLGVATFASANGTKSPGAVIIEPSPLSPVIASPRSNRTAGPPATPSISYIPQSPTPHTMDGITTMEPMSPDVTLDLPSSQYISMPGTNYHDPSALISPFGTTFFTESVSATGRNGGADSQPNKESESAKGGAKLQYKPRRRIPTPRRRSVMAERPSLTGTAEARVPGPYRMNGSITDVMDARDNAPASAPHEQDRAMGAPETEGKGRRPSLSRWSFGNPDGGIGKGIMRRLSRLRSNSDLRPDGIDSHAPKSAIDPKPPHSSSFSLQDGTEYRGYASDGVPTSDALYVRRKSSGSGMGSRLSRILPLPFPAGRQSIQHQHQNGSVSRHGNIHDEDDTSAHLWATTLSHSSIPLGRPARLSGAGSARGSASADGAHRHSTITVRSSDGWFTTMPAASGSVSAPGNASPTAVHFATIGHDISRQNSPSSPNPSRTSLTPAVPPHAPYHGASDPTTPTLGSLSTGNNVGAEGSASRRHSEQTASIPAIDLLKPPSQRGSLSSAHTARARPQSLQHVIAADGSPLSETQTKAELLNGIQHGPDSIRLLDVETAAAIRRSIDFEDRVRKGENVLRRALYGSESGTSPSTSSRTSSFSTASGGRGRGHSTHGAERSSSTSGRGAASIGPGTRRSGSMDHVVVGRNGLLTGGGVFLPSAVTRSPAMRYTNLNGSFHSTSSSGVSAPFHSHEMNGSGILRSGLNSASGTLTRGPSTLREGLEESFEVQGGSGKYGSSAEFGIVSKSVHVQQSSTLAKRVGRRISRIFVGKGTSAQGH